MNPYTTIKNEASFEFVVPALEQGQEPEQPQAEERQL